jgi:hypothetical protein
MSCLRQGVANIIPKQNGQRIDIRTSPSLIRTQLRKQMCAKWTTMLISAGFMIIPDHFPHPFKSLLFSQYFAYLCGAPSS